jgi:aldose 1-epimerase
LPAVQFYTGNNINNIKGKNGVIYKKHDAFCLETQYFPDSPNKAQFPSAIFGPERTYNEQALFEFNF